MLQKSVQCNICQVNISYYETHDNIKCLFTSISSQYHQCRKIINGRLSFHLTSAIEPEIALTKNYIGSNTKNQPIS